VPRAWGRSPLDLRVHRAKRVAGISSEFGGEVSRRVDKQPAVEEPVPTSGQDTHGLGLALPISTAKTPMVGAEVRDEATLDDAEV
jgi:hypothetical protein